MNKILNGILAKIPELECKGDCIEACTEFEVFPVEEREIQQYCTENKIPYTPFLKNEQLYFKIRSGCDPCKYLKDGKCSIYPVRPVICRLWGNVEAMPCKFGCKPDKVLTDFQGKNICKEVRGLR